MQDLSKKGVFVPCKGTRCKAMEIFIASSFTWQVPHSQGIRFADFTFGISI